MNAIFRKNCRRNAKYLVGTIKKKVECEWKKRAGRVEVWGRKYGREPKDLFLVSSLNAYYPELPGSLRTYRNMYAVTWTRIVTKRGSPCQELDKFFAEALVALPAITAKPGTVQGNYQEFISKTLVKIVSKREPCSRTARLQWKKMSILLDTYGDKRVLLLRDTEILTL